LGLNRKTLRRWTAEHCNVSSSELVIFSLSRLTDSSLAFPAVNRYDVNACLLIGFSSDYHAVDNFIVGLTDVSLEVTAPTVWNYDVCAQYPGVIDQSVTVYLPCNATMPARRYLVVQLERTNWLLNFCVSKSTFVVS